MKENLMKRVLSLMLVFAMLSTLAVPAVAAEHEHLTDISFEKIDAASSLEVLGQTAATRQTAPAYEDTDIVRVSIVLEEKSTLQAGFSTQNVAENADAMAYRAELEANQQDVIARIEQAIGAKLDVVWNLTLAANLISANVAYGSIARISAVSGVAEVVLENAYEPAVVEDSASDEVDPNQITSTIMSGATTVWSNGYTGAGSRIAVIDTGIDTDHQSFSAAGFEYSLALNAEAEEKTLEAYYEELDLLDEAEIASKLDQLNIENVRADRLYISSKIAFGYNYIDQNYKVTHDYDSQSEHGSHVEGIAAANSYIPQRDGSFAEALELTNVKGQAPDAQLIVMKVFGVNGGAYDSDYMAAIEDAIILGADSVNLSLGSGSAGFSFNPTYAGLLSSLQETDTVVTISAGNSYSWDDYADHRLYVEDVRFATTGSPGTYSNSLAVASVDSTFFNSDGTYTEPAYYEMSDFSSWGVPETLELKPEITAPGGNIYSVNGAVAGGKSYETMSGTSMAAPQMAGMAAVMAEYIRENNLVEKTGLSVRQLSQSLLMSTAQVLVEEDSDYYYSVLKQGAGMAQLDDATAAKSYILMGSDATAYAADGKVKAELGDDPDKAGVYSFSFTINNFSNEDTAYSISTELFTQYTNGTYLYGSTDPLAAETTYVVNGAAYEPTVTTVACDLNADGVTDAADAKIILSYCAGTLTEIDAIADLDGSGVVDAYDAHLILAGLETGEITVPAGSSVTVTVTAKLTDEQKVELDETYPQGAYVEGYVFIKGDVIHSIPILAFYGNWSDPDMFGVSYTETLYGDSRTSYFTDEETNNLVVSRNGELSLQTGNPYVVEDSYPEGKAAVRSDDILDSYRMTLQRNAGAVMLSIVDENGNELYNSGVTNRKHGAYYYVNGSSWQNTSADYALGFTPEMLGLKEGQRFTVTITAVPEYYIQGQTLNKDAVYAIMDSGILGEGATLTTELVVDNTAPEIVSIARDIDTDEVVVTVRDNQYVAAVRIVDSKGTVHATQAVAGTDPAGSLQQIVLDLDGVAAGDPCYISIGDYAGNEAVYEASLGLEEPGSGSGSGSGSSGGNMYGFSAHTGSGWVRMDIANSTYSVLNKANVMVEAAEYVDGYVFMVATDGTAYVAPHSNLSSIVALADLSSYGVEDMSFNYVDKQMYVLGAGNKIYTMDLQTGALTEQFTVNVVNTKNAACTTLQALAVDENGNFYVACDGGSGYEFAVQIFSFTLDMVTDGAINDLGPMGTGYVGGYSDNGQTLAWDYENDLLYYYSWGRYDIDTFGTVYTTGYSLGGVRSNYSMTKLGLTAIYFPGQVANVVELATEAESLSVNVENLKMLEGSSAVISTTLTPWTLQDQSLTWVSSDESVVTVKDGTVYAVAQGEATVTVTTNAEPHLSATIHISVSGLPDVNLYALLLDQNGTATWVSFNSTAPEAWEAVGYNDNTDSYGAVNLNDVIYVHDGSTLYAMNPDTFEKEAISGIGSNYAWVDAAETPFDRIVAPCFDGTGIAVIDPEGGSVVDFDVSATIGADLLVTMAYADEHDGIYTFYSVADSGNVYAVLLTVGTDADGDGEADYGLSIRRLCSSTVELPGANEVGSSSTAGSIYDAASGTLVIASYSEDDPTGYVYALEPNGGASLTLGNIGDAVWPFYSLYCYEAPEALTLRVRTEALDLYVGDEGKISASVAPISFTGGLTYTVADEDIASVDANGVVTALAPGDTTITVATVDADANGQILSRVIPLHVEDTVKIGLTINAKLDFDDEGSKWVTIDTTDIKNPTIITDDHAYLYSAAVHDGVIYANDGKYYIDWNYWAVVSNLYIIEPEYGYDITPGGLIGAGNMPTDMTTMPARTLTYTDAEGNEASIVAGGMPIYMDISEQLIMWDVAASDELADLSGWNLSGSFDGTPGAIAYLGMTTQLTDDGTEEDAWSYSVLTNTGDLYTINIVAYVDFDGDEAYVDYSAYMDYMGNVDLEFDYAEAMNMVYINDGVNQGLLVAYTDTVAELYYVDINVEALKVTFESGKIGSIPGTNTFGGMYFADELNSSGEAPQAVANRGKLVAMTASVGPDRSYTVPSRLTNDRLTFVDGSLASVQATAEAAADTETDEYSVKLHLTEDSNVVSGLVTVGYDPAVLTFTGTSSNLLTVDNAQPGKVTLAYASGTEIAAGNVLATLSFAYTAEYLNTTITIETLQRNAEGALEGETETVTLTYELGGHSYEETQRTAPTCTEAGSVTYVCANCGDSYTEELAATGHSYESEITAPTCTEQGYTVYTCSACGDSYTADYVDPTGHSYGDWSITVQPNHDESGLKERTCTSCGDQETEIILPLGHNFIQTVVEPTCTEQGYTLWTCECGKSYYTDMIKPTGHHFSDWTVTVEPTCTEAGEESRTCTDCGETETRVIAATGHSYEAEVVEPTCTAHGYTVYTCSVCGDSHTADPVDALGHSYGDWDVTVQPTHEEPGQKERICAACGDKQTELVLPVGHNFTQTVVDPTCTEQGYTVWICECGDIYYTDLTPAAGHSYETEVVDPTCTEEGYTVYICTVCGDHYTDDYTAPHCASSQFEDVGLDAWYHESIDFVLDNSLMYGMSDTIFNPSGHTSRAQLVTVLYRMAGSPTVEEASPFTDVAADSYYSDAVAWAYANGIAAGISADTFAPNASVTREQMVAFFARYAVWSGIDIETTGDLSAFTDADSVSAWAVESMTWAVEVGLISGMTEATLQPKGTTTRAQIATVLMHFCDMTE